ncbi:HPr family phosphocarrier protein [Endozoicomonas ascidiicola]|uniref:HPr family phosphocarrier protein n=1 Tax=Endozoicomonas ascidiicola TaxID=1698521 RepID=UPI00082FF209|nr:HPr family phosphocarrier protein [Endozoicomonas ascidiicola]
MITYRKKIINKLGLHARAASKFVTTSAAFACQVDVVFNGRKVDGKSIMAIMMLAAGQGSELELHCDGHDEEAAVEALSNLIDERFGEDE